MVNIFIEVIALIIIAYIIYLYIQYRKCCTKYSKIKNKLNLSGVEVIQKILDKNNLDNVYIVETKNPYYYGYSNKRKVIRISKKLFDNSTITDTYQASLLATYAVEDKNNKRFCIYSFFKTALYVLNIICFLTIIISCFIRDFYILKISILVLLGIIIITLFLSNYEYKILNNVIKYLIEEDIIDENNELLDNLSNKIVIQPIQIVTKFIEYINYKLNN